MRWRQKSWRLLIPKGRLILLGITDDGALPGLSRADVARLNQPIGNAASQHVRSPITVQTENLELDNGRLAIVLTVPKGMDKPYFDKNRRHLAEKRRREAQGELQRRAAPPLPER